MLYFLHGARSCRLNLFHDPFYRVWLLPFVKTHSEVVFYDQLMELLFASRLEQMPVTVDNIRRQNHNCQIEMKSLPLSTSVCLSVSVNCPEMKILLDVTTVKNWGGLCEQSV